MSTHTEALRDALAASRWYCLAATGTAMLCTDEADARHEAAENDIAYPAHGPHRAVQLVPASPELLAELDSLKAERDALRADAERWRLARRIGVMVPGTVGHRWKYRDEADGAIDAALKEHS